MYTLANMAPYIVSFLHEYVDANISPGFAISLSTGAVAAFGITLPLSGIFWSKVGIMRFVFVACLLNSASIFFSAFTIRVNAILFFFTYSILAGIAVGCGYGLVLQVALSWLPKKHGLVVGICTVGFGGGVTLLLPIQTILINPNNTSPNATTDMFEDVNMLNRIPPCLQITGALITGLEVVGCCFFRQRPSADLEMDEEETAVSDNSNHFTPPEELAVVPGITLQQALRTANFYLFWAIMFLSYFPVNILTAYIKTVAQTPIPDDRFLMVVSITGAIFNIIGRFFWGYIGDKVSFKIPMVLVNVVYAAALISLPHILWLPGAGRVCYAIWVPLLFLCLAGNFVLLTFGITRSMGPKHVASIYGVIFLASVPASLLGAGIFSQIDVRKCFNEIFLANGIIALSVSIFSIFLRDDQIPHWPRWLPCNLDRTKSPLFSPSTTPTEVTIDD
ncbi:oxalate:formate antiporter [Echinococcus multilocularis]|uniref:Oxalate:formate antiporter n=1 Tax=Echinococcus multilocularis TaxID=6211 RepID=A0A068Y1M4_ECHMU|nr:oxalate:formate antiporter [Echinococcus multilocularis]